jgi:hypothetical protein
MRIMNKAKGFLHKDELPNLYSSPNITRMIKSRRMGWTWHVAHMGGVKCIVCFGGKAKKKETTRKTEI